jgi:hypothetical protein
MKASGSQPSPSVTGALLAIPVPVDEPVVTSQAIYSADVQAQRTSATFATGPSEPLLQWSAYPGNGPVLPHSTPSYWRKEHPRMSHETIPVVFSFTSFPTTVLLTRISKESHRGLAPTNRASLQPLQPHVLPPTPDSDTVSLVPSSGLQFHESTTHKTRTLFDCETSTAYLQQTPKGRITSHTHARPTYTLPNLALLPSVPLPGPDGGDWDADCSYLQHGAVSSGGFAVQNYISRFEPPFIADFRTTLPTGECLGLPEPHPPLWTYPQQLLQENPDAPEFSSGQAWHERNSHPEQLVGRPA